MYFLYSSICESPLLNLSSPLKKEYSRYSYSCFPLQGKNQTYRSKYLYHHNNFKQSFIFYTLLGEAYVQAFPNSASYKLLISTGGVRIVIYPDRVLNHLHKAWDQYWKGGGFLERTSSCSLALIPLSGLT